MIKKKPIAKEAALIRMADLCARAEHCEYEIKEKLRKLGLSSGDIAEITEYLVANRYIDDSRYARALAADKVRFSGWGRNKIRAALALRHINSASIREALEGIDEKEYKEALMRSAVAKARSLDLSDYNDKAKLFRHLAAKGFESSLIDKAIRRL